ncbi:hypothetical protein TWF718_010439 [Orbilia javanica]|uniref:Uncharacterized protein n=1 Tax=Orbilia javanica TaxID=47235 RepID=A0AAN8MYC1_9PEZI
MFITSRVLPEITKKFENNRKLEVRAHDEDVRKYLDSQISNSGEEMLKDHSEEIITRITRIVDGMKYLIQSRTVLYI